MEWNSQKFKKKSNSYRIPYTVYYPKKFQNLSLLKDDLTTQVWVSLNCKYLMYHIKTNASCTLSGYG